MPSGLRASAPLRNALASGCAAGLCAGFCGSARAHSRGKPCDAMRAGGRPGAGVALGLWGWRAEEGTRVLTAGLACRAGRRAGADHEPPETLGEPAVGLAEVARESLHRGRADADELVRGAAHGRRVPAAY